MSESMTNPWIRDYLVDVAETYGSQPYNAPVLKKKKRVQLTDFLTYQENSYVWAWISDKDYRVSVRISKDAIDEYKSRHGCNIVDCRFFLVFVASYRPMFSPRPLGPNVLGNTPVSHISLEVGYISSIGIGEHLFGNPRDLESDEKLKEWILGLREDGGGGNILKLRKQKELALNKKAPPSPPSPPSFSLYAPVSQCQPSIAANDTTKHKSERPQDFKRVYTRRWRQIEVDSWKFAIKPAVEERPTLTESSHSLAGSRLDSPSRLESGDRRASAWPPSPHRTPSHTSLPQQGTPTDWSLSNRGSPAAPDVTNTIASGNGIQQHEKTDALPTISHLPSDAEEHTTEDTTAASDTCSLQPPTPAQRIKNSPLPRSSPPHSSPAFTRSPIPPSQQLPHSSPPPPSSSLPPPSSSLPIPIGIRKNFQRKIPHPGHTLPPPDPTKQGSTQILVPNSDPSGTDSQHLSQSQQCQSQSPSRPLPPSPTNEFKPDDASTPRETAQVQDTCERDANADHEDSQLSIDDADVHSTLQGAPPLHSPRLAATSIPASSTKRDADNAPFHTATQLPELSGSQGSMRSLFSVSLEGEGTVSSQALVRPISRNRDKTQEEARPGGPAHVPRHDSEAWKEPSFIAKRNGKGKARAVEEVDTRSVKVGKKRQRSAQPESPSPVPKRVKILSKLRRPEPGQTTTGILDHTPHQDIEASALGKVPSDNRPSTSIVITTGAATPSLAFQLSKPRLANFAVDFERINLGKRVPTPGLDLVKDIKGTLLRTGRIRTLGEKVEKDGSVYIHL